MPMSLADTRIEWTARFDAWKCSGLSVAEWCREQGTKYHHMYYCIRIFEDDVAPKQESNTQWLTVNVNDESSHHIEEPVFIHFGSISVEVRPGTNMELLSNVVRVLQSQ